MFSRRVAADWLGWPSLLAIPNGILRAEKWDANMAVDIRELCKSIERVQAKYGYGEQ